MSKVKAEGWNESNGIRAAPEGHTIDCVTNIGGVVCPTGKRSPISTLRGQLMKKCFYDRLESYFGAILDGMVSDAKASSVFPNSTDMGQGREQVFGRFLKNHAPTSAEVLYGGFLFNNEGEESGQFDIIVPGEQALVFRTNEKCFSSIGGTLAICSIKSNLNSEKLNEAMREFGAVPTPEIYQVNPLYKHVKDRILEWPLKVLYAHSGMREESLKTAIMTYSETHTEAVRKYPNFIVVGRDYALFRENSLDDNTSRYKRFTRPTVALAAICEKLQEILFEQTQVVVDHHPLIRKYQEHIDVGL